MCRDRNSSDRGTTPRNKQPQSNPPQQNKSTHNIHLIKRIEQTDEQLQILTTTEIHHGHQQEGAIVQARLNGYPVNMQLDIGATVTLLSETTWEDIDCPELQTSDIKLQNYSQQEIPLKGKCKVQVQCQGRSANLCAVISKGDKQNLLGRN